ncbi:DNA polymerase alpha catalytic subunit [Astathelohania contejeani]|uniref:DNA polymerase n=1 Tax=Astathelohania contejeani TaxID=164912 RepID=A0ABQ7I2L3_9MICR|nr:DNA polymerase alpha catalytic subunit [Thelohania contejeani]
MLFYILNIEQTSDSSLLLYGHQFLETPQSSSIIDASEYETKPNIIKVDNIYSPIYYIPKSNNHQAIIRQLLTVSQDVSMAIRKNYFYCDLPSELQAVKHCPKTKKEILKIEGATAIQEFSNPIECLIIGQRIMGPGIIELTDYQHSVNGDIFVNDWTTILFKGHSKIPKLTFASLSLRFRNNELVCFYMIVYNEYNSKVYSGSRKSQFYSENKAMSGEGAILFNNEKSLLAHLNTLLKENNPDLLIYHNLHKSFIHRLNTRGRLCCDLYIAASGLIKGRDYSIEELCINLLHEQNPPSFNASHNTVESVYAIKTIKTEAEFMRRIFEALNFLDLSKQMSEISGSLMSRAMQHQRADRIEFLLMHELYSRNCLLPPSTNKCKKENTYTGGLVFEPVVGFYETLVLLLDFNSLYPSIIQEYNICFSTIGNKTKENKLEENDGFLPRIIKNLVTRRKKVKETLRDAQRTNNKQLAIDLEIRQQALKLTANSMYGCLGAPISRFYNVAMASLITQHGREILIKTKSIAEETLGMSVIYGDTDSIMIDTKLEGVKKNYIEAMEYSKKLQEKINSQYRCIEIEVEKIFKKLLLYTKKKYGAIYIDRNGKLQHEFKGLDMVRRDFSKVSNDISKKVFELMLTDQESNDKLIANNGNETVINNIVEALIDFKDNLKILPSSDFVINTLLSKNPEDYATPEHFPHVSLALRLKESGLIYKKDDVVPFIIGCGETGDSISKRAFLPSQDFLIDYDYYIRNQILPPLHRLLSIFKGLPAEKINRIFGIERVINTTPQRHLTFINPCCGFLQGPSDRCTKCNKVINPIFYINKVYEMLRNEAQYLYQYESRCIECKFISDGFLSSCPNCQQNLLFQPKNSEFDTFLYSVYENFKNVKEIENLCSFYLNMSDYRRIDLKKYFKEEIEDQ